MTFLSKKESQKSTKQKNWLR